MLFKTILKVHFSHQIKTTLNKVVENLNFFSEIHPVKLFITFLT